VTNENYYYVSAEGPRGCTSSKQIIVVTPIEIVTPELMLSSDTLFTQSVSETYLWTRDGEKIASTSVPYIIVEKRGKYRVTCTTGTCTRISSVLDVSEFNFDEKSSLSLYPNPTTARNIHVKGDAEDNVTVKLTIADITGRELFTTTADGESLKDGVHIMPTTGLKNGMYFLILEENSKTRKIKFIIDE
jgi:hypothetical protein